MIRNERLQIIPFTHLNYLWDAIWHFTGISAWLDPFPYASEHPKLLFFFCTVDFFSSLGILALRIRVMTPKKRTKMCKSCEFGVNIRYRSVISFGTHEL